MWILARSHRVYRICFRGPFFARVRAHVTRQYLTRVSIYIIVMVVTPSRASITIDRCGPNAVETPAGRVRSRRK